MSAAATTRLLLLLALTIASGCDQQHKSTPVVVGPAAPQASTLVPSSTAGTGTPTSSPSSTSPPNTGTLVITQCPKYTETGKGNTLALDFNVPAGEVAFVDAYAFDDRRSSNVFVTLTGPFAGIHTVQDGAYCYGIPATADYKSLEQSRRAQCGPNCISVRLP